MSKAIVIGVASLGGAGAVGVGGYALFGNGFGLGGSSDAPTQPAISTNTPTENNDAQSGSTSAHSDLGVITTTTYEAGTGSGNYSSTLEKISETKDLSGWTCFNEIFSGLSLTATESGDTTSSIDISSIDFGTPTDNTTGGCWWIQTLKVTFGNDTNKKYTGILSWAWAFKGGDKGLVVFGVAKFAKAGNLTSEGVVYLVEQESEQWKVKQKKTAESKQITGEDSSDDCGNRWKKLPAANISDLSGNLGSCYLDWLEESDFKDKIASDSEAQSGSAQANLYRYKWLHNNSENKKIYDCFKDPHLEWFTHLFGTETSALKSKLDNWKGKWTT